MSTSGTATYNPGIYEIVQEAYERIGSDMRVGYDYETAARSINLLTIEWSNRGINMWELAQTTLTLSAGTATYNLPTDCIDVLEGSIRTNSGSTTLQNDISISRISIITYQQQPSKLTQGFPTQYMVMRGTTRPTITFWQVPDSAQTYTFSYTYLRRTQDVGTSATNTMDVPFRFIEALICGLAFRLSEKKTAGNPELIMRLKARYEEAWDLAASEDRERASIYLTPDVRRVW